MDLNAIPTVACPPSGADANRELEAIRLLARSQVSGTASDLSLVALHSFQATNSWILDYMIHGQRKYLLEEILQLPHEDVLKFPFQIYRKPVLAQDNGLNATRAWKLIDEFVQTLKKALHL